jgi:hypothetical protein
MPVTSSKNVLSYDLRVSGIWGRNRKSKNGIFNIVKDLENELDFEEAKRLAFAKAEELKVRPGSLCRLSLRPETVETHEDGIAMRIYMVFSDKILMTFNMPPAGQEIK